MSDKVHIVLAADAAYAPGLDLAKATIVTSASDASRLVFHEFSQWPESLSLPRKLSLAYVRLFLPLLIPDEDFVIWSDVDTLWRRDVLALWDKRDPDVLIMAPHDRSPETLASEETWMNSHGYGFDSEKYFCSGVMLMNLKKMRDDGLVSEFTEFIDRHDDVLLADQSVLNAVCAGRVSFLDGSWNVFSRDAVASDFLNDNVVVHYAGETPWLFRHTLTMLTDTRIEWFRLYASLVCHCSRRAAMRRYLSAFGIFWRRVLFLVATNDIGWQLVSLALRASGRGHVARSMKIWARRI